MVKSLGGVDWHYFTVENLHIYLYMCIHKIYIHKYDLKSYKEFFWHQFKFFSIIKYNMVILLFSHSVMSDSLQPHVLQHAMLPCPSLPPRACSNSRPSSQWYHLTISSSVMPSPPSSFPTSGSFPAELAFCIRWSKYWSFSFNISPSNEYSELISLRIDWFDLLAVQETLKSLLQHHSLSLLYGPAPTSVHDYWKNHIFDYMDLCWQSDVSAFWYNVHKIAKKAMATHSSTLAWKIPWMEEPGGLQSLGSLRVGHDWATSFSLFTFMHWRRKWQPTPMFFPGESQGRGSLVGCRLWVHTESDTTEVT